MHHHLEVGGRGVRQVHPVVPGPDDARQRVSVVHTGVLEDPGRCIDHHRVRPGRVALERLADQGTLRQVDGRIAPVDGDLSTVHLVERVFPGILVIDDVAVGAQR